MRPTTAAGLNSSRAGLTTASGRAITTEAIDRQTVSSIMGRAAAGISGRASGGEGGGRPASPWSGWSSTSPSGLRQGPSGDSWSMEGGKQAERDGGGVMKDQESSEASSGFEGLPPITFPLTAGVRAMMRQMSGGGGGGGGPPGRVGEEGHLASRSALGNGLGGRGETNDDNHSGATMGMDDSLDVVRKLLGLSRPDLLGGFEDAVVEGGYEDHEGDADIGDDS